MRSELIKHKTFCMGFSLIELSISMVVIGLLFGIFLIPFAKQREIKQFQETRYQIDKIKEAIVGFAISNGRLPCPADPSVPIDKEGVGEEWLDLSDINAEKQEYKCKINFGVVPWATLGVNETDSWDRRFGYRVSNSFSDSINKNTVTPPTTCYDIPDWATFALCSEGSIKISDEKGVVVVKNVPAVILSYGKNGYGAFLSNGKQISSENANQKEKLNSIDPSLSVIDQNLYLNFIYGTNNVDSIDDIVDWISPHILFNRMVQAGKLP